MALKYSVGDQVIIGKIDSDNSPFTKGQLVNVKSTQEAIDGDYYRVVDCIDAFDCWCIDDNEINHVETEKLGVKQ